MPALVTIDWIKIEDELVLAAKSPRAKVIDLACFRDKMRKRYSRSRARAYVVFPRLHGN